MFNEAREAANPAKLVTAAEMSNKFKAPISAKKKMFICPDCCEFVGFVYCTGKSSYFMHEKSDGTRTCEIYHRQIAGNQPYSPYKRTGLPLYLLRRGEHFGLNIGFYPVERQILADAAVNGLSFTLLTQEHTELATKLVNEETFSSQTTAFLQLAVLSKEYHLQFNRQTIPKEINEKWNNPIEGVENTGAFFHYHEQGGLKIRKAGEIEIKKDYYLLFQDDPGQHLDDSHSEKVGEISFSADYWTELVFNVYRIKINRITERNTKFCLGLGALLVADSLMINPLWPPCNKREQFYVYDRQQTALFFLKTLKTTPIEKTVLTYPRRNIRCLFSTPGQALIAIHVQTEETLITLDRPTAPFSCGLTVKTKEEKKLVCQVVVEGRHDRQSAPAGSHLILSSPSSFTISANFKGLVRIYEGPIVKSFLPLKKRVTWDKLKWREVLKIFHGLDLVCILEFKRPDIQSKTSVESALLQEFDLHSYRGNDVPAPVWLKYLLPKLLNYPLLSAYLQQTIKEGSMNRKARYELEKLITNGLISQDGGGDKSE